MPARIPLDPVLPKKILTALLTRNALKLSWTPFGGTIPMGLQNMTGKLLFIV